MFPSSEFGKVLLCFKLRTLAPLESLGLWFELNAHQRSQGAPG